jgi:hypothetical protein
VKPRPWTPKPDPAGLGLPGVRPHRHPQNLLSGWVFRQHQIWVDYWGNEHEIDSMPLDYVEAVIGFCERQARRIALTLALDAFTEAVQVGIIESRPDLASALMEDSLDASSGDATALLERTPLMRALRRRREQNDGQSGGR